MLKIIMKHILKKVLVKFFPKFIVNLLKKHLLKYNIQIPDLIYYATEKLLKNIISHCLEMLINKFLNNC